MSRLSVHGLRGRLGLALVLTSAITLGVAAAVTLQPLHQRLLDQSAEDLRDAIGDARPGLQRAMARHTDAQRRDALNRPASALAARSDSRIVVTGVVPGETLYDSETSPMSSAEELAALRAWRLESDVESATGDELLIASPLYGPHGELVGALTADRRLTEVTTTVDRVRNALLAAALISLAVAVALAVGISNTLLARLGRLRAVALRISSDGPDAPAPRDSGRDEVGDLARALARMQEDLRRQEAARRSFVATASHELRTPLTMLQGTMELLEEDLRDGADIPDAQKQVAGARRELNRLSALAGELLDLSRLDAAVQLRSEAVELGEIARAVAAEFELRARERDVALVVQPPGGPCWGRGDPDAVARVVRILLDNALRYAPPGSPVRLRAGCSANEARIEVADSGPGIPPAEREHIFERFHRGRATGPESGFGLGLAIGRELAERMGGSLRLDERPATGATFVLRVPPARASSAARSRASDARAVA